jgi:hypothetical protein
MASNSCARLMSRAKDAVGENRGSSPRWRAHTAQAEQDAVEARPTVSDPTKAGAALAEAEFARDRLQTSHPRDRPRSRQFGTSRMGFERERDNQIARRAAAVKRRSISARALPPFMIGRPTGGYARPVAGPPARRSSDRTCHARQPRSGFRVANLARLRGRGTQRSATVRRSVRRRRDQRRAVSARANDPQQSWGLTGNRQRRL